MRPIFSLSAGAVLLAGCATGGSSSRSQEPPREAETATAEPRQASSSEFQDAALIDFMINYSQLNCLLADVQMSNGTRPEVQKLAETIKRRESVNVEFLMSERTRLGVGTGVPNFLDDPHAADDKRRLEGLSGPAVDAFFVEHMIRHRLEIAKMAEAHSSSLESANLRYFCRTLADDAGPELRELRAVQTDEYPIPQNARAGSKGFGSSRRR